MCVCVCVLFGPVKPGVGNNSIRTKKKFNSEHLNFPGKELNVTDTHTHTHTHTHIYIYIYIYVYIYDLYKTGCCPCFLGGLGGNFVFLINIF